MTNTPEVKQEVDEFFRLTLKGMIAAVMVNGGKTTAESVAMLDELLQDRDQAAYTRGQVEALEWMLGLDGFSTLAFKDAIKDRLAQLVAPYKE